MSAVLVDRHRVDQLHFGAAEVEARERDVRIGQVPSGRAPDITRRDPKKTTTATIEDRGEQGLAVEARPAQPINRSPSIRERHGASVADRNVRFDRCGRRLRTLSLSLLLETSTMALRSGRAASVVDLDHADHEHEALRRAAKRPRDQCCEVS